MRIQENNLNESHFRFCSLSQAFDFDRSHYSDGDSLASDGKNDEVKVVAEGGWTCHAMTLPW